MMVKLNNIPICHFLLGFVCGSIIYIPNITHSLPIVIYYNADKYFPKEEGFHELKAAPINVDLC
jgi:hypothetical protein